jgi:hypothetical protein
MALVHHDLCFGCGQTNLFGLLLEVEPVDQVGQEPARATNSQRRAISSD